MFRAITEAAQSSILIIDERGTILAMSRSVSQNFGFAQEELLGRNVAMLMPSAYARAHDGYLEHYRQTGERRIIGIGREVEAQRKDGSRFPIHLTVDEFHLDGRKAFIGVCYDVSERRRLTERIAQLAAYDSLTGCFNRYQFVQSLDQTLQRCRASGHRLALLFIDLDSFKQINDNHGHLVGDRLLTAVATRFRGALRATDILGRVGGDEFVVASVLDGSQTADALAGRIAQALDTPFDVDGLPCRVPSSIGISLYPEHGQSADELINAADIAMYRGKAEGGNRRRLFAPTMRLEAEQIYHLVNRLRAALEHGHLELHYQLQFDLHTQRPTGLEALLRWRDNGTLVPPSQIIPVAQKYGLMPAITRWVIRRACADNATLIGEGLLNVPIAVNVCTESFAHESFVAHVEEILASGGLPAGRLELEITEDVAMTHSEQVLRNAQALRRANVQLAIDDFGTGYSSLGRLTSLRFHKLKIDRSFIAMLPGTEADQEIVRAMLSIARALGMRTVAEGIETPEQHEFLRMAGCDQGQGYGFARPMPLGDLMCRLRKPTGPSPATAQRQPTIVS